MKKLQRKSFTAILAAASALTLQSCGKTKLADVEFWSSFGGAYSNALQEVVDAILAENPDLDVAHTSHQSYDTIKTDIMSAIAVGDYPNVCVGYPDHFAEYIGNFIITPLNSFVEQWKTDTGVDLIKDEYYEAYMEENTALDIDDSGNPVISALPFNKSTELMGYNGVFVDYCVEWCKQNSTVEVNSVSASNWDLGNVPETWQEWAVKGLYYKYILNTLTCETTNTGALTKKGKLVYGEQDYEGTASNFKVVDADYSVADVPETITDGGKTLNLLLNFKDVDKNLSRVISWDATDNMFITLLRQWGSKYTELPKEERLKSPFDRVGNICFYGQDYRNTTIECLKYFNRLNQSGIFGVPQTFNSNYSSDAFEANKVMFMLCSSGGLSYNTAKWSNRFRVAHLPFYDDGTDTTGMSKDEAEQHVRKYVISQGADIAMTDKGHQDEAFKFMVLLTTGKHQVNWCMKTGYYPASKKAANSSEYQAFIHEADNAVTDAEKIAAYTDEFGNPSGTKVAYREGAAINQNYYMPEGEYYKDRNVEWHKFVDDAFIGSSDIRLAVKRVFTNVFALKPEYVEDSSKYTDLLEEVLQGFVSKSNIKILGYNYSSNKFE